MLRLREFAFGVCLSASSVARADIPADQTPGSDVTAEFDLLVKTGNRARLTGQYNEAARAYKMALEKLPHPVISGRFGLMLMKLGQLDRAAEELHEALERGQGVPAQERREVVAAYDKAKALTTRVSVTISLAGATVTCDGTPWNLRKVSSFWRFVMPGEHTLRAKLDGYAEAVETFTAKPGEEMSVVLRLVPLEAPKLPELPAPAVIVDQENRPFPPVLRTSNIPGDPNYDPREDPSYGEPKEPKPVKKKTGPRISVSGGVVTVFGVASWNPAVGAVVGVGLRPKDYFSLGLEGRAAWLTTPVAGREAISAMTAGGLLSACGHLKWFFGCGLGYVGTVYVSASSVTYQETSLSFVQPGVGGRLGAELPIGSSFVARANIDALRLAHRVKVWVGNRTIVDQPPAMLGAQVTGEWRF